MTKLTTYTPNVLGNLFDDFLAPSFIVRPLHGQPLESHFKVDIKENKKEFNIEFAAPGFTKKDFKIDVDQDVLTISAEKEHEEQEENENFTRKEFSYNSFSRSFTLPQTVSGEKIDAHYNDGILKLSVPKKEASKTLPKKEIKIA